MLCVGSRPAGRGGVSTGVSSLCRAASKAEAADGGADGFGAVGEAEAFGVVEGDGQGGFDAGAVDDAGDGEADVGDALIILEEGADGEDSVLVVQDGLEDARGGETDGVVGGALA